ncbi:MAG: hypothetical protein QOH24_652 [Verrucomicrobiota bacterium]
MNPPSINNSLVAAAICGTLALTLPSCARGPDPAETIRSLYGWYVRELKAGVDPLRERRSELKQFVTEGLLTSIDNLRAGAGSLDDDSLLQAGQFDQDWASKIAIDKLERRGGTATARVILTGRLLGERTLRVSLIREEGRWKVDDVKFIES